MRVTKKPIALGMVAIIACGPAVAGPPFVTDDPEPVDLHHFEINIAAQSTSIRGGSSGALPTVDINYGPFDDTQFHVGLSAPIAGTRGEASYIGFGDTEFGLKYRFIEEDEQGWHPQVAFYPNIDFPTGNAKQGLGSGHVKVLLPVWLQKSFGDWTSYGGGGYWLNQANNDRNYWFMGWALLRKIDEEWTLGGEVFRQTADLKPDPLSPNGNGVSSRASIGFNLGGYYHLDEEHSLMLTFGRGLQNVPGTNLFSFYLGYQLII